MLQPLAAAILAHDEVSISFRLSGDSINTGMSCGLAALSQAAEHQDKPVVLMSGTPILVIVVNIVASCLVDVIADVSLSRVKQVKFDKHLASKY